MNLSTVLSTSGSRAVLTVAAAAFFFAGSASADSSANGAVCQPLVPDQYADISYGSGVQNESETEYALVVCPMSADENVGSQAEFTVHVFDNSPSKVQCAVSAHNAEGLRLEESPLEKTTDAFVGAAELSLSVDSMELGGSYVVFCVIPAFEGTGARSAIRSIQVE